MQWLVSRGQTAFYIRGGEKYPSYITIDTIKDIYYLSYYCAQSSEII